MSTSPKNWMWTSVGLTLLVGVCLGLVVDRLVLSQPVALASAAPESRPMWFLCSELMLDAEDEPGYYYPARFRKGLLEALSADLELSTLQQDELEAMLEGRRDSAREFWENLRHAYCDVRDQFRSDIRMLLEEQQQLKFDDMLTELDLKAEGWVAERAAQRK